MIGPGQLVVAIYGCNSGVNCVGEVVSYLGEPSYGIRLQDGSTLDWAASLTREATADEQIEYWKQRALCAEGKS